MSVVQFGLHPNASQREVDDWTNEPFSFWPASTQHVRPAPSAPPLPEDLFAPPRPQVEREGLDETWNEADDAAPAEPATVEAVTVEAAEYRGRDFYGFGRTPDGTELFFRSDLRVHDGEHVRVGAAPERVLVYAPPA